MAGKRFLADLKRADEPDPPFKFDKWHAYDACDFIEKLPHVEGNWPTKTLVLHESHVFFVVQLFGFRNLRGGRRFTSALFGIARKNAKSTLSAAILLYCLCCEHENGPQVISAATTGDQARIVWGYAKRMVEKTADLREAFGLEPFANAIARFEVGGSFRPINAKASTQDGLNPSHAALDEIHAHKTGDLLNVLTSAAGARANPLWLYTTTEGYENAGPWGELRHFAKQVLQEVFTADHFLALYYCLDDEDEDFDESKWVKANPLMEVNPILLDEIRKAAIDAKSMPGRHAEFRIKRLNRQSATALGWGDIEKWKKCGGPVDLKWLEGKQCFGGLDLASTRDLCSFRLVWKVDGIYYTWGKRWVPEASVHQRTERGTVKYDAWVRLGYITQTSGDVADYKVIEKDILELNERFKPKDIAFDDWNARELSNNLTTAGVPLVQLIQGPKSYHPAMQELERAYMSGKVRHAGDPVLQWCFSNMVPRFDANMNTAPDRKRSADKIDDMAALLMAIARCLVAVPVEPEYQVLFL